jgi:hypothetical protein
MNHYYVSTISSTIVLVIIDDKGFVKKLLGELAITPTPYLSGDQK